MKTHEASMTVEGSFLFSWMLLLIVVLLRLDFRLHDRVLYSASEIMAALRYEQYCNYAYDSREKVMDPVDILGMPVLVEVNAAMKGQEQSIYQREVSYYQKHCLAKDSKVMELLPSQSSCPRKNAQIVRGGSKAVKLLGQDE